MKLTRIFCCLSGALALISCGRDVVFEDFESNSLGNWSVRGDAFTLSGDLGDNCSFVPEDIKGYEGTGYLAGSASADTSSITSRPFSIDSKYVNFLLGGTEGGMVLFLHFCQSHRGRGKGKHLESDQRYDQRAFMDVLEPRAV